MNKEFKEFIANRIGKLSIELANYNRVQNLSGCAPYFTDAAKIYYKGIPDRISELNWILENI